MAELVYAKGCHPFGASAHCWVRIPPAPPIKKDNPEGLPFLKSVVTQTTIYNLTLLKYICQVKLIMSFYLHHNIHWLQG